MHSKHLTPPDRENKVLHRVRTVKNIDLTSVGNVLDRADPGVDDELLLLCSAPVGATAAVSHIAAEGDLDGLLVVDLPVGLELLVRREPALANLAFLQG